MSPIVIAATIFGLCGAATWWVRRRLRVNQSLRRGTLELARQQLGWPHPLRQGFPGPSIDGHHCGYPVTLECVPQDHEVLWRIHSELEHDWNGHLLVHGEERPAKMKELYGMELLLTGDVEFDRLIVLASNAEPQVRPIFNRFLRERFRMLGGLHFQLEIDRRRVYTELLTLRNPQGSALPTVLDLMTTLCGMLDLHISPPVREGE